MRTGKRRCSVFDSALYGSRADKRAIPSEMPALHDVAMSISETKLSMNRYLVRRVFAALLQCAFWLRQWLTNELRTSSSR